MGLVKLWPVNFTLASYQNMLEETQFWTSFGVSLERVLIGVALNMVLSILMAYPLSKAPSQFRSKKSICGSWYLPCFSAAAWCPPLWSSISCT